jgi:hypothetical protein
MRKTVLKIANICKQPRIQAWKIGLSGALTKIRQSIENLLIRNGKLQQNARATRHSVAEQPIP